jgi:hypothetical protein
MSVNRASIPWTVAAAAAIVIAGVVPGAAQFRAEGLPVGENGVITPANLGANETWPLTIERATFVCEGGAVFVSDGTTQYPLNGVARTLASAQPTGRRPLEDIWRRDEKVMQGLKKERAPVGVVRLNITPVLARGERWCRQR